MCQFLHDEIYAIVNELGFEVGLLFFQQYPVRINSDDGIEKVFATVDVTFVGFKVYQVGATLRYGNKGLEFMSSAALSYPQMDMSVASFCPGV